jgi:hypothetical protein
LGFTTVFAALFAKTWRINKVLLGSNGFRKAVIKPKDVLWPLCILLSLNLAILTAWTIVAPLTWERPILIDGKQGPWRGSCFYFDPEKDPKTRSKITFAVILAAVNVSALISTNYQFYRARNLPTLFNETQYMGIANIVLFELCHRWHSDSRNFGRQPHNFCARSMHHGMLLLYGNPDDFHPQVYWWKERHSTRKEGHT